LKKVKLDFAGLRVEFCDREGAIRQVEEFAERGNSQRGGLGTLSSSGPRAVVKPLGSSRRPRL